MNGWKTLLAASAFVAAGVLACAQTPAGWLVDFLRSKRALVGVAVAALATGALLIALFRILTLVVAFRASARTEKKDEPLVWAIRNAAGFCGSIVTCAASIAEIGPGKLMVVTR